MVTVKELLTKMVTSGDSTEEDCDHEFEKNRRYGTYPSMPVPDEDGELYITRLEYLDEECEKCGKANYLDTTERKVYFDVKRTELVDE